MSVEFFSLQRWTDGGTDTVCLHYITDFKTSDS
jgi:hypothetical protein